MTQKQIKRPKTPNPPKPIDKRSPSGKEHKN